LFFPQLSLLTLTNFFQSNKSNSTVTGTQETLVNHWQTFELYKALIGLRSTIPALSSVSRSDFDCFTVIGDQIIALVRTSPTSISSQTYSSSSSSTTDGNSYIILSLISKPRDTQQVKVSINDLRARTSLLTSGSRWELVFSR
jgi:hypothetical protein